MSGTARRRARRSQQALLRPSSDSGGGPLRPAVVVDGRPYERAWLRDGGRECILIPGVPGAPGVAPIPERAVPFAGVETTALVVLRLENRYVTAGGREGGPIVLAVLAWSVVLDGEAVYCGVRDGVNLAGAMVDAAHALERLLAHPVRWHDPSSWRDRPCHLDGVPSHVRALLPSRGRVLVTAAEGIARDALEADPLSERLNWTPHALPVSSSQQGGGSDPAAPPDGIGDESRE